MEIVLILRYQYITTKIKQYLPRQHDSFQTRDLKGGRIKLTANIKIGFTFATLLAYPVIREISRQQGSLTQ